MTSLPPLWTARPRRTPSTRRPAHRAVSANARMNAPGQDLFDFLCSGNKIMNINPDRGMRTGVGPVGGVKRPVSCRVGGDPDSCGAQVTGRAAVHRHHVVSRTCTLDLGRASRAMRGSTCAARRTPPVPQAIGRSSITVRFSETASRCIAILCAWRSHATGARRCTPRRSWCASRRRSAARSALGTRLWVSTPRLAWPDQPARRAWPEQSGHGNSPSASQMSPSPWLTAAMTCWSSAA